jgi:hypothetical protein
VRSHRVFPALQPWSWRADILRDLVRVEHLAALRIEPVVRGREPAVLADLHFCSGERAVTIPMVYVDLAQLDLREMDPLVFPHAVLGVVTEAHAGAIVERVFPDIERRAVSGGFWHEEVFRYGDMALFERARSRGFFGASPLAIALPRIGAAVYARRFAFNKDVIAYGSQAIECAAFLGDIATTIVVARGDADADARAWYGDFAEPEAHASFHLAVGSGPPAVTAGRVVRTDPGAGGLRVGVSDPLPADVMLAFNVGDGTSAADFSVGGTTEPFERPVADVDLGPPVGRSAGRIAIAVRPDAANAPDSDTDEAAALAQALRREGFAVEIVSSVAGLASFGPELVHLFGVRPGGYARRVAQWASDAHRPLVVHAFHESPQAGGYWGAMTAPYCFGYSADDRSVSAYLEMLARRAVEVDGIGATVPYAPAIAGLTDSERVLALADVVLVNSAAELAVVEAVRSRRPTFIVPPLPVAFGAPVPVGAFTGTDPFMLVHAPVWPEANQLMLARAAGEAGLPLVFAGPIADPVYAERLREFAPARATLIGEPAADMLASLYRTASVVADAAWTTRGHGRLLTAAALGAAVVCSNARWLDLPAGQVWTVDPADKASVMRGVGSAWEASVRSDPAIASAGEFARERLRSAAAAIIACYAKIVQAV